MGGPNPGGSLASSTDTTPPVSSVSALAVTSKSPRSMSLPSFGPTTNGRGSSAIAARLSCPSAAVNDGSAASDPTVDAGLPVQKAFVHQMASQRHVIAVQGLQGDC